MKDLISQIIPILDKGADMLLIALLQQKLNQDIVTDYRFTANGLCRAKIGLSSRLKRQLQSLHLKRNKAENILDISCEDCKHSIIEPEHYSSIPGYSNEVIPEGRVTNYESEICKSCINRCDQLSEYVHKIDESIQLSVNEALQDEMILKTQYLITNIQKKLKNYAAS